MLFAAILTTGCAAPPQRVDPNLFVLQVYSEPPGAAIYYYTQGQWKLAGSSDVIRIKIPEELRIAGRTTINGIAARWPSGASKTDKAIAVNFANGSSQQYTIHRPPDTPGLDADLRFAASLAARQARQTAAQTAEERREQARAGALMDALATGLEGWNRGRYETPQQESYRPPPSYNCKSRRDMNQVITDCSPQ